MQARSSSHVNVSGATIQLALCALDSETDSVTTQPADHICAVMFDELRCSMRGQLRTIPRVVDVVTQVIFCGSSPPDTYLETNYAPSDSAANKAGFASATKLTWEHVPSVSNDETSEAEDAYAPRCASHWWRLPSRFTFLSLEDYVFVTTLPGTIVFYGFLLPPTLRSRLLTESDGNTDRLRAIICERPSSILSPTTCSLHSHIVATLDRHPGQVIAWEPALFTSMHTHAPSLDDTGPSVCRDRYDCAVTQPVLYLTWVEHKRDRLRITPTINAAALAGLLGSCDGKRASVWIGHMSHKRVRELQWEWRHEQQDRSYATGELE